MAKIVGGAAGPHSPVVYELPWPESPEYVANMERLRQCFVEVGRRVGELEADTILVIGSDHVQTFWFGNFPQLLLFTGYEAYYSIGGKKVMRLKGNPALAEELLFSLVDEGFDIGFSQEVDFFDHPFTVPLHWILKGLGHSDVKVIPFHVNTNVHPRVKPKRCYELGKAIRKVLHKSKKPDKVFVVGTGGLSHYPGTPHYGTIDEKADKYILDMMVNGKFEQLSDIDYDWLDATGNHELGSWLVAAGSVDAKTAEVMTYWPAWNNGYSVVWFKG